MPRSWNILCNLGSSYTSIVKYEHWALGKTSAATTHDELRRSAWIFIVCCLLRLALAMKRIYKRCRVTEVYSITTTLADLTKRIICVYLAIAVLHWRQKSYELSQTAAYTYNQVHKAKLAVVQFYECFCLYCEKWVGVRPMCSSSAFGPVVYPYTRSVSLRSSIARLGCWIYLQIACLPTILHIAFK